MNIMQRRSSCYTFLMILRATVWLAKCVGLSVIGIIVCGQVMRYSTVIVWWCLFSAGATHLSLQIFGFEHFFFLRAVFGFILGLVPLSSVVAVVRSMWARFGIAEETGPVADDDWARPLLWAWMPVAVVFAFLFLVWHPADSSVIATGQTEGRFEHFFNPMRVTTMNYLAPLASSYIFTLVGITGPMVFMMAYTLGVWTHHQFLSLSRPLTDDAIEPEEQPIGPR